jgi:hypothetical protein
MFIASDAIPGGVDVKISDVTLTSRLESWKTQQRLNPDLDFDLSAVTAKSDP